MVTMNVDPLNSPDPAPPTLSTVVSTPKVTAMERGPAAEARTVAGLPDQRSACKQTTKLVLAVFAFVALITTCTICLALLFLQQRGPTVEITNNYQLPPMEVTREDEQTKILGPGVLKMLDEVRENVRTRSEEVKHCSAPISDALRSAGVEGGSVEFTLQANYVNEADLTGDKNVVDNNTVPITVHNGNELVEFHCQNNACVEQKPSLRSKDARWQVVLATSVSCSLVCNIIFKDAVEVQECSTVCFSVVIVVATVAPSSCYPPDATVVTPHGPIAMSALSIGTSVQTPTGFQPVYFQGHKDFSTPRSYLTLTTRSGHSLTLTADHYVETHGPDGERRHYLAKHVSKGMAITVIDATTQLPVSSSIVEVTNSIRLGAFNPYVAGGRIIVDGVVASCHSAFLLEPLLPERYVPAVYESMFKILQLLYAVAPGAVAAFDNRFNNTGVWDAPSTEIASAALMALVL